MSNTSQPLERGRACLRCRRRKMRCDGARPICSPCSRSGIDDCEYSDGGPTTTQLLESRVTELEERIRMLEGDSDIILLHNPHTSIQPSRERTNSPRVQETCSVSSGSSATLILRAFVQHRHSFGFFLYLPRFYDALLAQSATSSPAYTPSHTRIPIALLCIIKLIGLLFIDDPQLKAEEQQIFTRAIQGLATDFVEPSAQLYRIQTEVFIAHYLFHQNRKVEGCYHVAAAVSLVAALNLHKIRSAQEIPPSIPQVLGENVLPVPVDAIEEGERIHAFWEVFCLDRYWGVWMQSPSLLVEDNTARKEVDTPWPVGISHYQQDFLVRGNNGFRTVKSFLEGLVPPGTPQESLLSLKAKAAILYERSVNFSNHWDPNSPSSQADFSTLLILTERFKQSLPLLDNIDRSNLHTLRAHLLIHTLVQSAVIHLHEHDPAAELDVENCKTLEAANAAVDLIKQVGVANLVHVDPFMGILWEHIGQVLVNSWIKLRENTAPIISPTIAIQPTELLITASLNTLLSGLGILSKAWLFMAEELDKLQILIARNQIMIP